MDRRHERDLAGDPNDTEGEPLTPSEDRIMRMVEQGMTTDAIEAQLHISHRGLRGHLAKAWAKLAPGRGRSGAFYMYGRQHERDDDDGTTD